MPDHPPFRLIWPVTFLARDEESHGCWRKLKAKFFSPGRQRSDSSLLISVFVGLGTLVDVRLPPPKKAVKSAKAKKSADDDLDEPKKVAKTEKAVKRAKAKKRFWSGRATVG